LGSYLSALSVIGDNTFIKKIYVGGRDTLLPYNENSYKYESVDNLEDYRVLGKKEISDTYLTKASADTSYIKKFTTRPSYCVYAHMGAKSGNDDKLKAVQVTSQASELASGAYTFPLRVENGAIHTGTPTVDTHAATKKYVDDKFASVSGGGSSGSQSKNNGENVELFSSDRIYDISNVDDTIYSNLGYITHVEYSNDDQYKVIKYLNANN
jgi:hypothetical protein